MQTFQFTVVNAIILFLVFGTALSTKQVNSGNDETRTTNRRLRKTETKMLRSSSSNNDVGINENLLTEQFEEDEKLWERILQYGVSSITFPPTFAPVSEPPTPPPLTEPFTLIPTSLPIMQEDEECELMVTIECLVEGDGASTPCDQVPEPSEQSECVKNVQYDYEVTNICDPSINPNCDSATIISFDVERNGEMKDLLSLVAENSTIDPTESAFFTETGVDIDFCTSQTVDTNVIVIADTSPGMTIGICSAEASNSFSTAITCDVSVQAQCFADASSGFTVPCSDFNPFALHHSYGVGCEHVHQYVYTLDNPGPVEEVITDIVVTRDGISNNILDPNSTFNLDPSEIRAVNEFQLVDYCKQYPNGITTTVEVNANTFPSGGSCSSIDEITVYPAMEPCQVFLDPDILCTVETLDGREVPCGIYHELIKKIGDVEQCQREVTFKYKLVNEGVGCIFVYSVTAEIDNEGSFDLTPDNGKNLCPKESLILEQKQIEDFCDDDLQDNVVVVVNDGPPETCGGFGVLSFFPPKDECIIDLELTCSKAYNQHDVSYGKYPQGHNTDLEFTYKIGNQGESEVTLKEIIFSTDEMQFASLDLSGHTIPIGNGYIDTVSFSLSDMSTPYGLSAVALAESSSHLECKANDHVPLQSYVKIQCLECPKQLLLKFTGGKCSESRNSQAIQCSDKAEMPDGPARILVTDSQFKHIFFDQKLNKDAVFAVGDSHACLKTDLVVKIIHYDNIVQLVKFDGSCNMATYLGDIFGSVMVVGWTNHKQGVLSL